MSRRDEILAEMGIAPVWRCVQSTAEKPAKSSVTAPGVDWIELKQPCPGCTQCGLHKTRTQTVFGVGDENADWMLIGEAPGAEEDRLGDPFVGQAGRLLDNMLAAIGLSRAQERLHRQRAQVPAAGQPQPEPEEVAKCSPHLLRQIELIQPKLIVAMGRFAAQTLLEHRRVASPACAAACTATPACR